jgi:hypothetical protein
MKDAFSDAWKIYRHKAPVQFHSSQQLANKAFEQIRLVLVSNFSDTELDELGVARFHAVNENREEFDIVTSKMEEKLKNKGFL